MTILDYLAAVGGNPEWSLSYLIWQQIQQSGSRATLQERNKGGDAVGEDDKGKTDCRIRSNKAEILELDYAVNEPLEVGYDDRE